MAKIVVITSFMHQRGGDLVAAISFMKAIISKKPDTTFEWIIKRDISSYEKKLAEFKTKEMGEHEHLVNLTILDSIDYQRVTIRENKVFLNSTNNLLTPAELQKISDENWGLAPKWFGWVDVHSILKQEHSDKFTSSDVIAVVGNPHRIIKKDHEFFAQFQKPICIIPEYDLVHINNQVYHKTSLKLTTGFDKESEGIYIDEVVKFNGNFNDIDPNDTRFIDHLFSNHSSQEFLNTTTLFYGYFFNNDNMSGTNFTVKIKSFIQNCIILAIKKNEKFYIDIIMPGFSDSKLLEKIYIEALDQLPSKYLKEIKSAEYHLKNPANFDVQSIPKYTYGKFSIRLINPKRLERQTIQVLLNQAEPFLGLTGDASWIEGLIKGKLTCYQVVRWKENFFDSFLKFLKEKFPDQSPLRRFYELQKLNYSQSSEINWTNMVDLYITQKERMLDEARQLSIFIEKEKNLNNTLIPKFISRFLSAPLHLNQSTAPGKESLNTPLLKKTSDTKDLKYHLFLTYALNNPLLTSLLIGILVSTSLILASILFMSLNLEIIIGALSCGLISNAISFLSIQFATFQNSNVIRPEIQP